jgi:murein DD-endopeptidase MepM/ murein hydrolase activator NlpD
MAYLKSYRAYREQQAINIANTQSQLEQKISNLNLSKKEKSSALEEQNKQFKVLAEERAEKNAVVSKIKGQERELTKEMNDKRKQDNKLKAGISAAIKREIAAEKKRLAELEKERKAKEEAARKAAAAAAAAAKKEEGNTAATKPAVKPVEEKRDAKPTRDADVLEIREEIKLASNIFEKNQGGLPWPVNSRRITMKFGRNKYEGLNVDYVNEGITIEAEANSSIKAVFDGEVSAIFSIGSIQAVIIKHGKYFTTYSNLSKVTVSKGEKVKTGQLIGRLEEKDGGRGELEFLITNDNQVNLNPELWLGK